MTQISSSNDAAYRYFSKLSDQELYSAVTRQKAIYLAEAMSAAELIASERGLTARFLDNEFTVINNDGVQEGPFETPEVKKSFLTGKLDADSLVHVASQNKWLKLGEVFYTQRWTSTQQSSTTRSLGKTKSSSKPKDLNQLTVAQHDVVASSPISSADDGESEHVTYTRLHGGPSNPRSANEEFRDRDDLVRPLGISDDELPSYGGIGRFPFLLIILGTFFIQGILLTVYLVGGEFAPSLATMETLIYIVSPMFRMIFVFLRLGNMGLRPLWAICILVPILQTFLTLMCLACPEGFGDSRKLDRPGKITLLVLGPLFLFELLVFTLDLTAQ